MEEDHRTHLVTWIPPTKGSDRPRFLGQRHLFSAQYRVRSTKGELVIGEVGAVIVGPTRQGQSL